MLKFPLRHGNDGNSSVQDGGKENARLGNG